MHSFSHIITSRSCQVKRATSDGPGSGKFKSCSASPWTILGDTLPRDDCPGSICKTQKHQPLHLKLSGSWIFVLKKSKVQSDVDKNTRWETIYLISKDKSSVNLKSKTLQAPLCLQALKNVFSDFSHTFPLRSFLRSCLQRWSHWFLKRDVRTWWHLLPRTNHDLATFKMKTRSRAARLFPRVSGSNVNEIQSNHTHAASFEPRSRWRKVPEVYSKKSSPVTLRLPLLVYSQLS